MKTRIKIILIVIFCFSIVSGQIGKYNYQREIAGISDTWHKIVLPDEIFGRVTNGLNDIRIYGITEQDTIEAPYLLKILTGSAKWNDISFMLINQSHNAAGYYFTFKISSDNVINQINLNFNNNNFDWRINLEGSQNMHYWFTVLKDYRILSIKNEITNYTFSTLKIPDSHYNYYRLLVKSVEQPELTSAQIYERKIIEGVYRDYSIKAKKIQTSDRYKQTEILLTSPMPVPITFVKLSVSDQIDYYRPIIIQYLIDSVETEKGWIFNYSTIFNGTLSSLEDNEFRLSHRIANKLKLVIRNHDNQPLSIESITVKGNVYEMIVRCNTQAQYYLVYGNKRAHKPDYDIVNFKDNIPKELTELSLGDEHKISKAELLLVGPLFQNQAWLWVIMVIIILVLGWFSIRMLKTK